MDGAILAEIVGAAGCRTASSTWSTAAPATGARARRRAESTASPSPARRRSGREIARACTTGRTRGRRSPRWAARTRRSSPRTPTSTRRPRGWRAPPSGCRARSAARARARSSSTTCTTTSSPGSARGPSACRSATRPTARASWGRWSTRPASRASRRRWPRRAATARSPPAAGAPTARAFVEPTVVSGLPLGHPLERDELFLPFVTVTRVGSLDDAMAEANAPAYGLTAGIFSEDPAERRSLPRRDPGRRRLRQPPRRRDHGRVAGHAVLLRLEVERDDGQGRARPVLPHAVHARAEPDRRRVGGRPTG